MMRKRSDHGFSFVEVLLALTILLAAMAPLLHIAASGQRLARTHGEATDLHQRLRVAAGTLRKDLSLAGAGGLRGPVSGVSGGLTGYLAPLVPARTGARAPDAPLSAFSDRVSLVHRHDQQALVRDVAEPVRCVGRDHEQVLRPELDHLLAGGPAPAPFQQQEGLRVRVDVQPDDGARRSA